MTLSCSGLAPIQILELGLPPVFFVFKSLNLDDEHRLELEADLLGALDFKISKDSTISESALCDLRLGCAITVMWANALYISIDDEPYIYILFGCFVMSYQVAVSRVLVRVEGDLVLAVRPLAALRVRALFSNIQTFERSKVRYVEILWVSVRVHINSSFFEASFNVFRKLRSVGARTLKFLYPFFLP